MIRRLTAAIAAFACTIAAAPAPLHDAYLDHLVGPWRVSGTMLGKPFTQTATGSWVLAHQFVRVHFAGGYQADVFIGYDAVRHRYVEHWLDQFGGAGATAVGFGSRTGNAVTFAFAYADGPFRNTMAYDAPHDTWHIHFESGNAAGTWSLFGDEDLKR